MRSVRGPKHFLRFVRRMHIREKLRSNSNYGTFKDNLNSQLFLLNGLKNTKKSRDLLLSWNCF